ncbi:MAG TPA: GNAT family protein [Pseudonocardiaceae bacterium]|nr:GNAT family protein [Pseudonocardiaceae bacterium]
MTPIETGRLVLRPIRREVAHTLLDGGIPRGLRFAPGYPSLFSFDVLESVISTAETGRFGPYFMTRRRDGAIIGEIECRAGAIPGTGSVGYTVVESCWGQGYATEALRALLARVLTAPGMTRVVAETPVGNIASRRVMEKAGMSYCGQRKGHSCAVLDGEPGDVVVFEALARERVSAITR